MKIDKTLEYLIACDIDGTLLNSWGKISKTTLSYLNKMFLNYPLVTFCLITGRPKEEVKQLYHQLNLDTVCVMYNGGLYSSFGKKGFKDKVNGFSKTIIKEILSLPSVRHYMSYCHIWTYTNSIWLKSLKEVDNFFLTQYDKLDSQVVFMRTRFDPLDTNSIILNHYKKVVGHLNFQYWPYQSSNCFLIELQADDVHKGMGVQFLSEYYSIPYERIICFGDNNNDLEMLTLPGCNSFAMANSSDIIKAKAKYILNLTNDQDGVVHQLNQLFPVDQLT